MYVDNCCLYSIIKTPHIWKALTFSTSSAKMQKQASAMCLFNSMQNVMEYQRMLYSYCSLDAFFFIIPVCSGTYKGGWLFLIDFNRDLSKFTRENCQCGAIIEHPV